MKKIVVLTGSPRKNGNSNAMADSFIAAAQHGGFFVTRFDTAAMNLSGCHACDNCFKTEDACVFHDDFNTIAPALLEADAIVIISPVYWYTFTAQIKMVIDKLYALCMTGKDFNGKVSALIACCAEDTLDTFDGIRFAYEKTMALMKCRIADEILVTGVDKAGDIMNTDGEKRAADLVKKLF